MMGSSRLFGVDVSGILRMVFWSLAAAALGTAAVAAAAPPGAKFPGSSTDTPEIGTGRDALRQIVQDHCVVNWSLHHMAAPCERVVLADSKIGGMGYAVLADRKGGAHYLLIPTQTMAGVESSELLDPDTPNYFAEAWRARDVLTRYLGREVPRSATGLAVNKVHSRTQDQFHIHIECLRRDVVDALRAAAPRLKEAWSPIDVAGSSYDALRVTGDDLANPFDLLASRKPDARHHMGDYTLVVAGMQFDDGPGFVVLAGTGLTGELLLDSSCTAAGG